MMSKKKKRFRISGKLIRILRIVGLFLAIIVSIITIYQKCPSCRRIRNNNDYKCTVTLNESQIRKRIDKDLQNGDLKSAINLLVCLDKKETENAYEEEAVLIIGWCIKHHLKCEYLEKAEKVASMIKNPDIRFQQREIISIEKLKKNCK